MSDFICKAVQRRHTLSNIITILDKPIFHIHYVLAATVVIQNTPSKTTNKQNYLTAVFIETN